MRTVGFAMCTLLLAGCGFIDDTKLIDGGPQPLASDYIEEDFQYKDTLWKYWIDTLGFHIEFTQPTEFATWNLDVNVGNTNIPMQEYEVVDNQITINDPDLLQAPDTFVLVTILANPGSSVIVNRSRNKDDIEFTYKGVFKNLGRDGFLRPIKSPADLKLTKVNTRGYDVLTGRQAELFNNRFKELTESP